LRSFLVPAFFIYEGMNPISERQAGHAVPATIRTIWEPVSAAPWGSAALTGQPILFAVGGAHMDRRAQVSGDYVPGASNPGIMREEVGGGALNACSTLVRRGVSVRLMSVRGGDAAGATVADAIKHAGIEDLSSVHLDRTTPGYLALIDRDGTLIAGLADMALYETAFARQLARRKLREAAAGADAVLLDANLPEAAVARLLRIAPSGKPVFAIAISPAKVVRLAAFLPRIAALFMNLREARVLAAAPSPADAATCARILLAMGLNGGTITDGGRPVTTFDNSGIRTIAPPPLHSIVDETGAGDALAGATAAAMIKGAPIHVAVREGIAAARLAIASASAVPKFSASEFAAALRLVARVEQCPEEGGAR
jgi:sugar/nucleoside kinase (ribokinase family)